MELIANVLNIFGKNIKDDIVKFPNLAKTNNFLSWCFGSLTEK